MSISINEGHKVEFDEAADALYRRAGRIKEWRHKYPKPDETALGSLKELYRSTGVAREKLKYAIEGYYGIHLS